MYVGKTGSRQFVQRWLEEHGADVGQIRNLFRDLSTDGDDKIIATRHDIVRVRRLGRDSFKIT